MIRWLWRKNPPTEPSEAQRAHIDAVVSLAESERRGMEVRRVSRSLAEWRERNHVVAQLDALFYGGRS